MNLRFGHLGNGITVYDKDNYDEHARDYKTVAHIRPNREVKYYVPFSYNKNLKKEIEEYVRTANPNISVTQDIPVFINKV